jgi:AraC-like DNA-binding protein
VKQDVPFASLQVTNPEQLAAAIRSANFEPCQLSSGPSASRLTRLMCPKICLDFAELGPAMLFTGVMPMDCYTLVFVTNCPETGHSFNFATDHRDGYLGFFPPGGELDAYTPEGYANATLTVPEDEFHQALEQWFPEIPDEVLKYGTGLRVGAAEQTRLRILLSAVMDGILDPGGPFVGSAARREVERSLLEEFMGTLRFGHPVPLPKRRIAGRLMHLRQARDFIKASAHKSIRLEDVGNALGMSARGVEVLFRSSLGIGPNAFIRHQRLHGVRRALLAAEPEPGVVKELALQWGFWHMGHFSKNYRTLFGECPTSTLAGDH